MPVWKFQNYITDNNNNYNQNKLTKIMKIELLIKIGMQLLMRSSISAYDGEWSSLLLKMSFFALVFDILVPCLCLGKLLRYSSQIWILPHFFWKESPRFFLYGTNATPFCWGIFRQLRLDCLDPSFCISFLWSQVIYTELAHMHWCLRPKWRHSSAPKQRHHWLRPMKPI